MSTAERLRDLADAVSRHASTGEPLLPSDLQAIAATLHAEADAMTERQRLRSLHGWRTRKAA